MQKDRPGMEWPYILSAGVGSHDFYEVTAAFHRDWCDQLSFEFLAVARHDHSWDIHRKATAPVAMVRQ
jgi:hypothetical protein